MLKKMKLRPLVDLHTDLPQTHREKLERFSPAEVSAMRVKAQRLLEEATEASDELLTDEQLDSIKEASAVFIVSAASILLDIGGNLLLDWLKIKR